MTQEHVEDVDQGDGLALGDVEDPEDPKELADPAELVAEPWDDQEGEGTDGEGD